MSLGPVKDRRITRHCGGYSKSDTDHPSLISVPPRCVRASLFPALLGVVLLRAGDPTPPFT